MYSHDDMMKFANSSKKALAPSSSVVSHERKTFGLDVKEEKSSIKTRFIPPKVVKKQVSPLKTVDDKKYWEQS